MPPTTSDRAAALSLPSFAQAFSSLGPNDSRALPPIHNNHNHHSRHIHHPPTRSPSTSSSASPALARPTIHHQRPAPPSSAAQRAQAQRKRPRENDDSAHEDGPDSSDHSSPRSRPIKQEPEHDQLDPTPTPSPKPHLSRLKVVPQRRPTPVGAHSTSSNDREREPMSLTGGGAPPPSLARPMPNPPSKRRRVTISGVALNTSNLPSSDGFTVRTPTHTHGPLAGINTGPSTPISPVVMGFTIQRDDPGAIEQVRAMLSVKQKQKALIESRRGSVSSVGVTDGRRGSTAGLLEGRRGSVSSMHPVVTPTPSVHVVNPTPTTATAPGPGSNPPPPKRSGPSPNGGLSRLGPSPPSMTVPPNVTTQHSPNNSQRSSPLISTSSAKAPASNVVAGASANNVGTGAANTASSAAGPGGRAISPSVHVVPSHNTRAHPGSASSVNTSSSAGNNRSPPSQHQLTGSGQAHSHSTSSHPIQHPSQASQSSASGNANMNARDGPPHSSAQLQQVQHATRGLSALADNLPPPPTSFARRRAGQLGMRNKPADIVISPRDSDSATSATTPLGVSNTPGGPHKTALSISSYKSLQPAIQSAPPVPRPGQDPGRFPMALPSLPPAISQRGVTVRRAPGQVPPTPTRLSMQRTQGSTTESASVRLSHPTSSSLAVPSHVVMPATPVTFHRAVNTSTDKTAFLAPFEQFYDALSDAQVLKNWFGEQLRRVGKVVKDVEAQRAELDKARAELERQKEEIARMGRSAATNAQAENTGFGGLARGELERLVSSAVHQEVGAWKDEVSYLRNRVHELEDALRSNRPEREREVIREDGVGPSGAASEGGAHRQTNGALPQSSTSGTTPRLGHARTPSHPNTSGGTSQPGGVGPSTSNTKFPAAADSYTFPSVQALPPPPSASTSIHASTPASTQLLSHPRSDLHSHSHLTAHTPGRGSRWEKTRRSVSPTARPSLRNRESRSRERGGRSPSRSTASSPAPSVDTTIGRSGISRRLSVSAMRDEPPANALPPVDLPQPSTPLTKSKAQDDSLRPTSSEGAVSATRKGVEKPGGASTDAEKPELRRHNSHHGVVSANTNAKPDSRGHARQPSGSNLVRSPGSSSSATTTVTGTSPPKRPASPMDEDEP